MDLSGLIGALIGIALIAGGALAFWAWVVTTRRRAIERARARAQADLDALAAQVCESLAAGEPGRHGALLARYERLRDELAAARTLRTLHKVAARARTDALLWRARGAFEDAIGRAQAQASAGAGGELAREAIGAARAWWSLARSAGR